MIESPLLQRMIARALHGAIREVLKARFGTAPRDVSRRLSKILDERKLHKLNLIAVKCPSLEKFREALLPFASPGPKPRYPRNCSR